MCDIRVELHFDAIKIYFGNLLHAYILRSKLLGIQSWRAGENNYFIEYTLNGNNLLTEYDDLEKFQAVLKGLEEIL